MKNGSGFTRDARLLADNVLHGAIMTTEKLVRFIFLLSYDYHVSYRAAELKFLQEFGAMYAADKVKVAV